MKYTYMFDEADPDNVKLLGGKASGLVMMTRLGLPVPYGMVITTEACKEYYRDNKLPNGLMDEVRTGMHKIEEKMGRRFGDPSNPLLVSVRSGAAVSMPGMMDTVLNLGLNDSTVNGLAKHLNSEHAALDAYRRFLSMFGKIVLGIREERFNDALNRVKAKYG
ncbi:MAG: PEP/pyruvate-binding domain-containing protein, partial [Thermocladium sp.]